MVGKPPPVIGSPTLVGTTRLTIRGTETEMEVLMARRADKDIFLDALKKAPGNRAGNTTLQRDLGWNEEKYWKVHQQLFDAGVINKGKGYGGSVILTRKDGDYAPTTAEEMLGTLSHPPIIDPTTNAIADASVVEYASESDLYPFVKEQLEKHWTIRRQLDDCHCEITALQGRRDTGGSWSRPDLSIVAYRKYEFLPEKVFELFSFEVKPSTDVSIKGVMEALAHREAATRSYVIYHTRGQDFSEFPEAERIEELAARHGIGVYAAKQITDFNQWAEVVSALRASPDPEAIDTFIRRTLSDAAKTKIRKWF